MEIKYELGCDENFSYFNDIFPSTGCVREVVFGTAASLIPYFVIDKVVNCWFFNWFISEIDLCQTWNFSNFPLDAPAQCWLEKAILIQISFFGWGKGCVSYCIKNRSWNLKEAFSEGCAISEPPAILGSENSDITRVTN